jgi:hypothetical protein
MRVPRLNLFYCLLLGVGLMPGLSSRAQGSTDTANTIAHVSIASPTAASLGKYGDIPVSYHTGIPQIEIPIYSVKSGSLQLPIGLSYHAGGLKVQELASWVGAGWSLNAGGAITRTVVGAPDDRGYSSTLTTKGHYTHLGYNSYYNDEALNSVENNLTKGVEDGEPDLYFFNFGRYTGKFYFNDDRTPVLVPEQDFKIQPTLASGYGFTGFVITTPDGVRYYFGHSGNNGPLDPVELTNPSTAQNGQGNTTAANSSWFLNKILSADGMDSITLNYTQENYSYYAVATYPVPNINYLNTSSGFDFIWGMNVTKNVVQGVRLSQINFANGSVTFTRAASPRSDLSNSGGIFTTPYMTDGANTSSYALGSISISTNNGFCKKDSFFTSYFYDPSSLPVSSGSFYFQYNGDSLRSDAYRLRLDSIRETSCDASQQVPPYRFTYFSEPVPRRLGFGIDHWGYSNGVTTNTSLVPTFTQFVSGAPQVTAGANRDASWPSMRGGALQQITYPTGGTTSFDFEPKNVYSWTSSVLQDSSLRNLAAMAPGQSNKYQALDFWVANGPYGTTNCTLDVDFNPTGAPGDPDIKIYASDSSLVYSSGYIVISNFHQQLTLQPGHYMAVIEYTGNFVPDRIAALHVGQYINHVQTTTQTVGGLRIKTVSHSDAMGTTPIVTSYNYTGGGSITQGTLYSRPVYVQILRNDQNKLVWSPVMPGINSNGCASIDGYNAHYFYISGGSIQPMSTVQGENFGYNEVDVSQTGNGHTVYRYYSSGLWGQSVSDVCVRSITQSSLCDASIPTYPAAPIPFEFMRDELQYEGVFNESGQLLKETYHYPQYVGNPLTTPAHIGTNMPGLASFTEYQLQTSKKVRDSTVTFAYDPSSGTRLTMTAATYFSSPYHHQPTQSVSSTSTGDVLTTKSTYAMDLRIPSCDAIPDSLPYYQAAVHNDTVWLYANIDACSPQTNDETSCRLAIFSQFELKLAADRQNFIRYRRRSYAADSTNLLNTCYLNAMATADTLLKPVLRLQNAFINPSIEVSSWRNTSLLHAAFTRYDTATSPVGFVYPGRTKLINLQAPSISFTTAAISGNTIAKDSRYVDETFYFFSDGNARQVISRDGIANSYIWDYANKEPIAKVVNATVDQIAYTSFEADGNGSWTIPSGTRDNSAAMTGGSSYNLTSGSISRSGLSSGSIYIVSYWSKTGSAYTISGSTHTIQGKTINGFTYFEHTVTGVSSVTVSGSGDIDELRLYPSASQMTTYTYNPGIGISSQCDVNNRITYYFYDALGRLHYLKDQDGNIVKTIDYHYMGQ